MSIPSTLKKGSDLRFSLFGGQLHVQDHKSKWLLFLTVPTLTANNSFTGTNTFGAAIFGSSGNAVIISDGDVLAANGSGTFGSYVSTGNSGYLSSAEWRITSSGTTQARIKYSLGSVAIRNAADDDYANLICGAAVVEGNFTHNGSALGFFGATPVAQQSGQGETAGFTAGAGSAVKDDSTFTGNVGSNAYTVGDIVKALKNVGILETTAS